MADKPSWLNNENSASSIFNRFIRTKLKNITNLTTTIITADADAQQIAEEWLTEPTTKEFITNYNKSNHMKLGYVKKIEPSDKNSNKKNISYIDQYGNKLGFAYIEGKPQFKEAPNGFSEGDIILTKFTNQLEMESVKPIKLRPKTEIKVIRRFMNAINKK